MGTIGRGDDLFAMQVTLDGGGGDELWSHVGLIE